MKTSQISAVQSLRKANKETKSISGTIKVIKSFWKDGYKDAFKGFGLDYKSFEYSTIKNMLQTDAEGNFFVASKRGLKDDKGEYILDTKGKRVYETYNKVITTWSPTTLFRCLEQSTGNK